MKREFVFGKDLNKDTYYDDEKGFGIIDFLNAPGESNAEKCLLSGGWNYRGSDAGHFRDCFEDTGKGVRITEDRQVLCFKTLVPEYGTYKVKAELCSETGDGSLATVFTNRRNLVRRKVEINKGEEKSIGFYAYATPYIPALTSIPNEEKAIYVSVTGKNVTVKKITVETAKVRTIFIAGDSTLTDQGALAPFYPIASCCGWAQDILAYVKDAAVCNYAHSGLTTNCFRDDGHWDILRKQIKPGDIFMIQFGHNDQKRRNLAAFGGYYDNLKWYVARVRELGAFPIICSPISRVPVTDDDGVHSLLARHALACREASVECGVPFIDLHEFTFNKWQEYDRESLKDFFIPGDITHTSDYGAQLIADYVADRLSEIPETAGFISGVRPAAFKPEDDVKTAPQEAPSGKGMFEIDPPYIDMPGISKYDGVLSAFRKGLLDPCVMFIHPDNPMPRAQLLMVYLKALRISGERPYLGRFCDLDKYEWDSSFVQRCVTENLIDASTVKNGYFRPDDPLTNAEFASFCIRGLEKDKTKRDIPAAACLDKAKELGIVDCDAVPGDAVNRQSVYAGLARLMDILENADQKLPGDAEIHPVG